MHENASCFLIFNFAGATGLYCDGVDGGLGDSEPEGEKRVEVLAQSVHHLLSEGGRGFYSFHTLLSFYLSHSTNTDH